MEQKFNNLRSRFLDELTILRNLIGITQLLTNKLPEKDDFLQKFLEKLTQERRQSPHHLFPFAAKLDLLFTRKKWKL